MIETLHDWNTRLENCGCCSMPPIPGIYFSYQQISAYAQTVGFIDSESHPEGAFVLENWELWMERIYSQEQIGTVVTEFLGSDMTTTANITKEYRETLDNNADIIAGGIRIIDPVMTTTCSGGGTASSVTVDNDPDDGDDGVYFRTEFNSVHQEEPGCNWVRTQKFTDYRTDPVTVTTNVSVENNPWVGFGEINVSAWVKTYENPYTWTEWLNANEPITRNALEASEFAEGGGPWETFIDHFHAASYAVTPPVAYGGGGVLSMLSTRVRFTIGSLPSGDQFSGSKLYITYDIAEFPEEGDPSFVSQNNVLEWTGATPREYIDVYEPFWHTDWIQIDAPEVPGKRRIVNIRWTSYAGTRFGSKGEVIGEAFELPPP